MTAPATAARHSYLWVKCWRLSRLAALAALVAFGGYSAAQRLLDRRLHAVTRALDAHEGGWRLEELQRRRATVPDEENAARVVSAVAEALPRRFVQGFYAQSERGAARSGGDYGGAAKSLQTLGPRDKLTLDQAEFLRAALQKSARALAVARRLADYDRGRFQIEHSPSGSAPAPNDLGIRRTVFLLRHDALLSLHEGRPGDGLRACRAVLAAGRALGDEPAPAYQVLRWECWDEALQLLDRALSQAAPPDEDLRRTQRLLETEAAEPLELHLLQSELAFCHLRFSALEAGHVTLFESRYSPPVAQVLDWLARDAVKFPHAGALEYLARRIAVARLPTSDRPAALKNLEQECRADAMLGMALGEWRSGRLLKSAQHGKTRLWTAAAAVAAERYRARHGRWPDTLSDLVPAYLAAAPDDSYTGLPLRYRRHAEGVVVYSVGRDGRDNLGQINASPDAPGSDVGFRLWDAEIRSQESGIRSQGSGSWRSAP